MLGVGLSTFAPAKINLHLHVVGRRDDGYHLLDSLVVFAGVGDRLSVSAGSDLSLTVTGPFAAGLAAEPDNLVLRAARGLADLAGIRASGALVLEKNLPVASGIGGGSADAAATLRLLCRFWGVAPDLDAFGAGVGGRCPGVSVGATDADVGCRGDPGAGSAAAAGRAWCWSILGWRFRRLKCFGRGLAEGSRRWLAFLAVDGGMLSRLRTDLRGLRNDLQAAACSIAPVIGDVLDVLGSVPGCLLARMSGSGATCFGLFASAGAAREAAVGIRRAGWWVWGGGIEG